MTPKFVPCNQYLFITADQVVIYKHENVNDVWLYNETHDPNNLFLLSTDALTVGKDWPDYVVHGNKVFRRDQQFAMPQHLDMSSHFGLRKYVRARSTHDSRAVIIV